MKSKLTFVIAVVATITAGNLQKVNAQSWSLAGNAIPDTTKFIGTTNDQPLIFKTKGVERMRISRPGNVGIGVTSPSYPLHIVNSTSATRGISVTKTYSSNQNHRGVYSSAVIAPGWGIGIETYGGSMGTYSNASGGNFLGSVFGVAAIASGTAGTHYGIYGSANGGHLIMEFMAVLPKDQQIMQDTSTAMFFAPVCIYHQTEN
jgi:hypothetical protein